MFASYTTYDIFCKGIGIKDITVILRSIIERVKYWTKKIQNSFENFIQTNNNNRLNIIDWCTCTCSVALQQIALSSRVRLIYNANKSRAKYWFIEYVMAYRERRVLQPACLDSYYLLTKRVLMSTSKNSFVFTRKKTHTFTMKFIVSLHLLSYVHSALSRFRNIFTLLLSTIFFLLTQRYVFCVHWLESFSLVQLCSFITS